MGTVHESRGVNNHGKKPSPFNLETTLIRLFPGNYFLSAYGTGVRVSLFNDPIEHHQALLGSLKNHRLHEDLQLLNLTRIAVNAAENDIDAAVGDPSPYIYKLHLEKLASRNLQKDGFMEDVPVLMEGRGHKAIIGFLRKIKAIDRGYVDLMEPYVRKNSFGGYYTGDVEAMTGKFFGGHLQAVIEKGIRVVYAGDNILDINDLALQLSNNHLASDGEMVRLIRRALIAAAKFNNKRVMTLDISKLPRKKSDYVEISDWKICDIIDSADDAAVAAFLAHAGALVLTKASKKGQMDLPFNEARKIRVIPPDLLDT